MKQKLLSLLFLALLGPAFLCAQTSTPDCQFTFTATAAGAQSPSVSNLFTNVAQPMTRTGCTAWTFKYATDNANAVSVQMEGAADAVTLGKHAPTGSYTALTVSTASGSGANPETATTSGGAVLCCDYYPWIRLHVVTLTAASGTPSITVLVYGYKTNSAVNGGVGGPPTGPAGGGLAGFYPNPTLAGGPFVQLQASSPGTQQTGNSNISGVGIFGNTVIPNNLAGTLGTAALLNAASAPLYNSFLSNSSGGSCTSCTLNSSTGFDGLASITTGFGNTNNGAYGLSLLTSGSNNSSNGFNSLGSLTSGNGNIGSGYQAGMFIADGSTPNRTSSNSLYDGLNTFAYADGDTNENVVGNQAIGAGSNTTVLGDASITDTWFGGSAGASNAHAKDFVPSSAAPGITGCSSATIIGNDQYGVITAGGTSCNAVLTFSYSALHGWSCSINNRTHPGATNTVGQASTGANSATFAGVTITSDVLNYVCGPY